MTLEAVLFIVLGALAIGSGIGVVTSRNPIAAAMLLVVHFIGLAGLYLSLSALFMAAIQVLVYAGAIMVLVVFVIMLLNLGSDDSLKDSLTSRQGLGIGLAILLGGGFIFAITRATFDSPSGASVNGSGTINSIGQVLFTDYVFPFEMVSLILLAAVVGAVVLTKKHLES